MGWFYIYAYLSKFFLVSFLTGSCVAMCFLLSLPSLIFGIDIQFNMNNLFSFYFLRKICPVSFPKQVQCLKNDWEFNVREIPQYKYFL